VGGGGRKEKYRGRKNNCLELKKNHQKEEHKKKLDLDDHNFSNKELDKKFGTISLVA
jgi:non-gastric H+/K+-exchanging ATPase